jgi:hypothetical protein
MRRLKKQASPWWRRGQSSPPLPGPHWKWIGAMTSRYSAPLPRPVGIFVWNTGATPAFLNHNRPIHLAAKANREGRCVGRQCQLNGFNPRVRNPARHVLEADRQFSVTVRLAPEYRNSIVDVENSTLVRPTFFGSATNGPFLSSSACAAAILPV